MDEILIIGNESERTKAMEHLKDRQRVTFIALACKDLLSLDWNTIAVDKSKIDFTLNRLVELGLINADENGKNFSINTDTKFYKNSLEYIITKACADVINKFNVKIVLTNK